VRQFSSKKNAHFALGCDVKMLGAGGPVKSKVVPSALDQVRREGPVAGKGAKDHESRNRRESRIPP